MTQNPTPVPTVTLLWHQALASTMLGNASGFVVRLIKALGNTAVSRLSGAGRDT